jgi:hypothetical protein
LINIVSVAAAAIMRADFMGDPPHSPLADLMPGRSVRAKCFHARDFAECQPQQAGGATVRHSNTPRQNRRSAMQLRRA